MSTQRDFAIIPFIVSATVEAFRFVTWGAADTVAHASSAGTIVGVSQDSAVYSSSLTTDVPVKLVGQQGTFKITASGAITAGAKIYVGASGKATATANAGGAVAIANQAAAADGDIIEAIWLKPQLGDVVTVAYTAIAADGVAGYYDFATGLGAIPSWYQLLVYNGSTGAARVVTTFVWTLGTGRATVASLATGDKMMLAYRA